MTLRRHRWLDRVPPTVSAKKKIPLISPQPIGSSRSTCGMIRLRPSSSDYATFARTTARVLGKSVPSKSELKPNKLLLSLLNLGS